MKNNNSQVKFLGDVAFITAGQGAPQGSENFSDKGYPFIRAGSLEKLLDGSNYDQLEKIEEAKANKYHLKLFSKGCILFAKSGMSAMKDRVVVLSSSAYVVSHLAVIYPNECLDSKYLGSWLSYFKPSRLIKDESYPSISLVAVSKIKIPLPPLPIQKQIAEILEQADKAKQKRKEANKLTDEFLRSLFIKMFGDPILNKRGWKKEKLGQITHLITDGKHGDCISDINSGYYFLSAKDINNLIVEYSNARQILKEDFEEVHRRTNLKPGDLLLVNTGATIGKVAILPEDNRVRKTTLQKSVAVLKLKTSFINVEYLKYSFIIALKEMVKSSSGSAQKNLLLSEIRRIQLATPPIELQNKFAEIVIKTEALKEKQKQSEQELENLFYSLMQKAFKGELVI